MENSVLARILRTLNLLLPLIIGMSGVFFGIATDQMWQGFAALVLGILGQIIVISILTSDD